MLGQLQQFDGAGIVGCNMLESESQKLSILQEGMLLPPRSLEL